MDYVARRILEFLSQQQNGTTYEHVCAHIGETTDLDDTDISSLTRAVLDKFLVDGLIVEEPRQSGREKIRLSQEGITQALQLVQANRPPAGVSDEEWHLLNFMIDNKIKRVADMQGLPLRFKRDFLEEVFAKWAQIGLVKAHWSSRSGTKEMDLVVVRKDLASYRNRLRGVVAVSPPVTTLPSKSPNVSAIPTLEPTKITDSKQKRFIVAFSFPGEVRDYVSQVAGGLSPILGDNRIFYDENFRGELARPDLDTYLQGIYHDESELLVVFLGGDYARKDWCYIEWRAIRDIIKGRRASDVMFFRTDDQKVPGTLSLDGYIDTRKCIPSEAVRFIIQRLNSNRGNSQPAIPVQPSGPDPTPPAKVVRLLPTGAHLIVGFQSAEISMRNVSQWPALDLNIGYVFEGTTHNGQSPVFVGEKETEKLVWHFSFPRTGSKNLRALVFCEYKSEFGDRFRTEVDISWVDATGRVGKPRLLWGYNGPSGIEWKPLP